MKYNFYFFQNSKSFQNANNLQSLVIDWLRFPLAFFVVFIHSFGDKEINFNSLYSNPFALESIYNFLRIALSNVCTRIAVPIFFMFSGFLFFYKIKEFNVTIYKKKLHKRFVSLFIPYICWVVLYIIYLGIFDIIKGKSIEDIIYDRGGLNLFWDSFVWAKNTHNWLGWNTPMNAPILTPLWFVRDLMIVVLFTPIIYYVIKKSKLIPIILLAISYVTGVWIQLFPGFSIISFFWFSLGAYFSICRKNMVLSIYKFRYFSFFVSLCLMIPLMLLNGCIGDGITPSFFAQKIYPFFIISASFSLLCITKMLIEKRNLKVYPRLAHASFFIYVCHMFVLGFADKLINKCLPFDNYVILILKYLAMPILTVMLCLVIYYALNKMFPKTLAILTGSRK